jgi:N-acetylglucosaminyldiphosphoundecaprenol N-acetyl-beta-D-mannosaminyltransferase
MSDWNRMSVALLGLPFDNVTMQEAVDLIEEKIDERGFHQVATANVDFVIRAMDDQELQDVLCSCDLIVPDGMPIVWASRLMGSKLKQRVSGIDLIPRLAELASRRRYGIFLLGASEASSCQAAEALKMRFPDLHIAGRYSPPVSDLAEMDHEAILTRIEDAQPHILLVAMGHPKQEQWLAMHRHRLRVPLCMGVGASLDFLAGAVSRAPVWMQQAGLEWLYRTAQEPRRLFSRYLSDAFGLARHLPAQLAANAIQPRWPVNSTIETVRRGTSSVISITGHVCSSRLTELKEHLERAYEDDTHIVLNMAETAYFGLDSVGFLVHLAKTMKRRRRHLWLAAVPGHVSKVFRAARVSHLFVNAGSVSDALYRVWKLENRSFSQATVLHPLDSSERDIHVRVEMLKDLCRRIVFLSQATKLSVNQAHARTAVSN